MLESLENESAGRICDFDFNEWGTGVDETAMASDDCACADLKRLINEQKIKYACDENRDAIRKSLTEYGRSQFEISSD